MEKFVCIHGHFYQPPRENPWLEEVEVQDSAYPYRDWNARINAECYAPNTASRIKSGDGKIIDIVNNYTKMSFNFGPTLLSWMETSAPNTYESIIKADVESRERYSGHGSAIAQVYNHMIMPLANTRDKRTQVIWGIEDFKYRFGREPEGMWLAETAVDTESLEVLAEFGIKFTILAPRQAKQIRKIGDQEWIDVSNASVDPKRAYLCKLPSGRSINLFFYDGPISHDIVQGDLLKDGTNLTNELESAFGEDNEPQLVNVSADGEIFGHQQKYADMALAFCMHKIDENDSVKLTVYGEFLEKVPPAWEVEIIENTSNICIHGIERWKSNCGCNTGSGWSQEWRAPLREALDWLREELTTIYENGLKEYVNDPWKLRDEYIKIVLNRYPENIEKFFSGFVKKELSFEEKVKILKYLEIQRHAMLMYTSSGWFFDEISGTDTVQILMYAARAIQLAKDLTRCDFDPEFIDRLKKAPSNLAEVGNGAYVYENYVKPATVDLFRVAAHYAISTLFQDYLEDARIYCYEVHNYKFERLEEGRAKLVKGTARLKSRITYEETNVTYTVIYLGDQNVIGGVREAIDDKEFQEVDANISEAFKKLDITNLVLILDKYLGTHNYNLGHLFKDESRKIFNILLKDTMVDIEHSFRETYENYYPVMQAINNSRLPLPKAFITAVEYVLNTDVKRTFERPDSIQNEEVEKIINEVKRWAIHLDSDTLSHSATNKINALMEKLAENPEDISLMKDIEENMKLVKYLNISANLWSSQNILFLISREYYSAYSSKAKAGEKDSNNWKESFDHLLDYFDVKIG